MNEGERENAKKAKRKERATENDDRELRREEGKLKRRGLQGIAPRREMVEVQDVIVKEKRRRERKEEADRAEREWLESSGLSSSRLASRIGKLQCDKESSSHMSSGTLSPKAIRDEDAEMDGSDIEAGLQDKALLLMLRFGGSSKAGTSLQSSAALSKDVASTGTDSAYKFAGFVATPGASSYDSVRDDVDDDHEDLRSRQGKKSNGEATTTKNLEVVKNLLAA